MFRFLRHFNRVYRRGKKKVDLEKRKTSDPLYTVSYFNTSISINFMSSRNGGVGIVYGNSDNVYGILDDIGDRCFSGIYVYDCKNSIGVGLTEGMRREFGDITKLQYYFKNKRCLPMLFVLENVDVVGLSEFKCLKENKGVMYILLSNQTQHLHTASANSAPHS